MRCGMAARGAVELYVYGELAEAERDQLERHLAQCAECRDEQDDLAAIRAALAVHRDIDSPPGGDWTQFMGRLETRLRARPAPAHADVGAAGRRAGLRQVVAVASLAAAAALVIATVAVTMIENGHERPAADPRGDARATRVPPPGTSGWGDAPDPALLASTDQHFQRSKVVVLGLTTRDASAGPEVDWADERDLAAALLSDTHVYRIAAETRGLTSLAGVMRDLEFVLLEASMASTADGAALEHVQGLIRRRDLMTKMNAVYTAAHARYP